MAALAKRLPAALTLLLGVLWAAPASAAEITRTYRIGPLVMPPYGTQYDTKSVAQPRIDGSLTAMHAQVVDARGNRVPEQVVTLHHVTFVNNGRFDGDKSQSYCTSGYKERFYGTGEEDQSLLLPPGYGYRVRSKDRWHASWMVMNHTQTTRKVYIEYTLKMNEGFGDTPVTPYWLGVAPCPRDPIFQVPGGGGPGSTFTKAITWVPPVDGRIVAVGTHLHGGAKAMNIREPDCANRVIATSQAQYGPPGDPIYRVLPMFHEPSPRFNSYPMSAAGIPVRKGRPYRVEGVYDNELPHARVMAIMHAYVAPPAAPAPAPCAAPPTDVQTVDWTQPFRLDVPRVRIPLAARGRDGKARALKTLAGPYYAPRGDAVVLVKNLRFSRPKIVIDPGRSVRWLFEDPTPHDVTTANGPTAFGSQALRNGQGWHMRFTRPGLYQIYCTRHPLDMHQIIKVRATPRYG